MSNELKTLLFTDKYKPKTYSDLLTEEKTNREILTWMKSWDEIVFNRKFTIPKIPIIQNINNQNKNYLNKSKKIVNSNSQNLNEKNNINQIEYYEVEYVQSKHKIILISGPPGIGKTTMANIISRQCGYEPIIINSSDERTADKLITRIYDTTLMHNLNVDVVIQFITPKIKEGKADKLEVALDPNHPEKYSYPKILWEMNIKGTEDWLPPV